MSKFYSTSHKDNYLYYVEGFRHPTTAPENNNVRCGRVMGAPPPKYNPPHNVMRRPYSFTYDQVLYSNPQFTADSSQATLPYEDVEDHRLNTMRGKSVHYHLPTSKRVTNVKNCTIPSHSYYRNAPPVSNQSYVYDSVPLTRPKYCFPPNPNDYHPGHTRFQNNLCSETEETLSEAVEEEEEYTESEDELPSSRHPQNTYTKLQVNANPNDNHRRGDGTARSSINVESTMKHMNDYNRSLPGKKMNPQELETLVRRLKKEPVSDDRYIYKKPRCLESSYKKAAEILRQAKGKIQQKSNPENKTNAYEQYRRRQYSQLLLEDSAMRCNRETALGRDASGNVFLGCQKHVKQISSQYSIIKPNPLEINNTELKCAPIPEEQQLDAEIKGEKPVKLQKELSEPLQFSSKSVFQALSEKSDPAQNDKLPILHRSKRIPRRKRNLVGIRSCAKALKKFTEYSQIAIEKQSPIPPPLIKIGDNQVAQKIQFTLNFTEKTMDKEQTPSRPQSSNGTRQNDVLWDTCNNLISQIAIEKQSPIPSPHIKIGDNPEAQQIQSVLNFTEKTMDKGQTPSSPQSRNGTRQNDILWNTSNSNNLNDSPVTKTEVTLNVKNMISKLDEIENLINSKKTASSKRDCSTSQSSLNIDESTNTASSNEIVLSRSTRSGKKTRKSSRSQIHLIERGEVEVNDRAVQPDTEKNCMGSIRTASFESTKSMLASLVSAISTKILSTNNSISKYDSTADAKIFRSIFEPESRDTTRDGQSCSYSLQSHRRQVAFDSSSGSDRNKRLSDKPVAHINRYSRKDTSSTKKESSVVTVFPAYKRDIKLISESATTNVTSDVIPEESDRIRKVSKIPKLKRRGKADDSSSDNSLLMVRSKYKGKKRLSNVQSVSEENRLPTSSVFSTLRGAFCIIIDFLFRYFKNLFIL